MEPNALLATVLLSAITCSGASAAGFDDWAGIELGGGPEIPVLPIATRYSGQETHVYVMDLQGAIDDAQPGDRIEVGPGIWAGGLIVEDKSDLLIFGSMGPVSTIIDGQTLSRGLKLANSNRITIDGLQFRNCVSVSNHIYESGAGVNIEDCQSMHMTECWFKNNTSVQFGGGLNAYNVDGLTVRDSLFMDNQAGLGGAAMLAHCGASLLEVCLIADNEAHLYGGGLYVTGRHDAEVTVSECYFTSNKANNGSAVASWSPDNGRSSLILSQCVMVNNAAGPTWMGGSAAVWCDQNMDVRSLACTYWKNTGHDAGCAAVQDTARLSVFDARMYGNRSRTLGTDMINFGESADAVIANSRIDCGRQFSDIVAGEYEEFGQNEIIDHCVYTADMNFDATIDIHDLLTLFNQWGPNPEVADLVRSSPGEAPRLDAADLILILETWGETVDHPLF